MRVWKRKKSRPARSVISRSKTATTDNGSTSTSRRSTPRAIWRSTADLGAPVAWAKSTKTGKWYVCETAEYSTDTAAKFRAVPYRFHTCRVAASDDRIAAEADLAAAYAMRADAQADLMARNEARTAAMGDE